MEETLNRRTFIKNLSAATVVSAAPLFVPAQVFGNNEANIMLTRMYREPYVVPQII